MNGDAGAGITEALAALTRRLRAVVPALLSEDEAIGVLRGAPSHGALLAALSTSVAREPGDDRVWLLAAAVAGGFPTADEVRAVKRGLELSEEGLEFVAVLSGVAATAAQLGESVVELEVVTTPVVDVHFCANHTHNTGIQRVVRNTVPHWMDDRSPVLAAWSRDGSGYRPLTAQQAELVVNWGERPPVPPTEPARDVLLVPWRTSVLLPEVPALEHIERLSGLAQFSGNRVGLIGYDTIPIVSADTMVDDESHRFSHYLSIVKHAAVVAGISEATSTEFRGFGEALAAQGLSGPTVLTRPLPGATPIAGIAHDRDPAAMSLVLTVGSLEPRKNQYAVLSAAEYLWNEGLRFELKFIGGGSAWFVRPFLAEVQRLRRLGRPVTAGSFASDAELAADYERARVVVFPSLQEGYGLPVSEALVTGTPVITTQYGSTAEIAREGGCLLIDPRDARDVAAALRTVLTDDAAWERLAAEARARASTTWEDYAEALWAALTGGAAA